MASEGRRVMYEIEDFDRIWPEIEPINGWLTKLEGGLLWDAARHTQEGSTIIEVGSFCGKSTRLLASTGRKIYAVDPLCEEMSVGKQRIGQAMVDSLTSACEEYPNITWVREFSKDASVPGPAAMLYVDALHKYPHPKQDFEHFLPSLAKRSVIAWHDYGRECGVTKSIHELIEAGTIGPVTIAGSLFVTYLK